MLPHVLAVQSGQRLGEVGVVALPQHRRHDHPVPKRMAPLDLHVGTLLYLRADDEQHTVDGLDGVTDHGQERLAPALHGDPVPPHRVPVGHQVVAQAVDEWLVVVPSVGDEDRAAGGRVRHTRDCRSVRQSLHMIVVHAGNRMDVRGGSQSRFPGDRISYVRSRLDDLLAVLRPAGVVTAAAAGADLLMAEAAITSRIPLHLVLAFDRERFRRESVADQGVMWTTSYVRVIERVRSNSSCSLTELAFEANDDGYRAGNQAMLDRAQDLGGGRVLAVTVRHCDTDAPSMTDDFVDRARSAGLFLIEVDPLGGS